MKKLICDSSSEAVSIVERSKRLRATKTTIPAPNISTRREAVEPDIDATKIYSLLLSLASLKGTLLILPLEWEKN
jgi:hypothetical protein